MRAPLPLGHVQLPWFRDLESGRMCGTVPSIAQPSDDRAVGNSHAFTCGLESRGNCFTCGQSVGERRSLPGSRVLECNGLDLTAEDCVSLLELIEGDVQLFDNCLGLIGDDDQFDID